MIVAVADIVEAMSSDRPYRAAKGLAVALEEIKQRRGSTSTLKFVMPV